MITQNTTFSLPLCQWACYIQVFGGRVEYHVGTGNTFALLPYLCMSLPCEFYEQEGGFLQQYLIACPLKNSLKCLVRVWYEIREKREAMPDARTFSKEFQGLESSFRLALLTKGKLP